MAQYVEFGKSVCMQLLYKLLHVKTLTELDINERTLMWLKKGWLLGKIIGGLPVSRGSIYLIFSYVRTALGGMLSKVRL